MAIWRFVRNAGARLRTSRDLVAFFWRRKIWWMTPMVIIILIFGVLVILGQSSAIGAFIYALF